MGSELEKFARYRDAAAHKTSPAGDHAELAGEFSGVMGRDRALGTVDVGLHNFHGSGKHDKEGNIGIAEFEKDLAQEFDYVHYSIPRRILDDVAEDLGFGRVSDYRLAVLEDDLVLAQITKSILPFLGRSDAPSVLALDQFSLILGAHLIQQYGVLQKTAGPSKGGLSPWQKKRACDLLHENMHARIRLSEIARECELSISHFARSFKASFGTSAHQWLIRHRIDYAKQLMSQTSLSLSGIAIQSGFNDQAAFTRTFHQLVGVSPGRWRRHHTTSNFRA